MTKVLSPIEITCLHLIHWLFRCSVSLSPKHWKPRIKRKSQIWWMQFGPHLLGQSFCLINTPLAIMKIRSGSMMDLTAIFGRYSTDSVMEIIHRLPEGATFVDIGAHIGRYTIAAAKTVGSMGRVLAVEPHPDNYQLLADNVALNHFQDRVKTHRIAMGDREDTVRLWCTSGTSTHSIMDSWFYHVEGVPHSSVKHESVLMQTLSRLLKVEDLQHVDLLKIDVEGAESLVLKGGTDYLCSGQIREIVCEVHEPIVSRSEIGDFLCQVGYETRYLGFGQLYAEKHDKRIVNAGLQFK